MNFSSLKNVFLKIMIFCLVASGILAVTTVLTGSFNATFAKALLTILLIAAHSLVSFGYIGFNEKNKSENDLSFFHNSTFIIIILSFITSIFGAWNIIGGDLVAKLYATYFVLLFAILHAETLSKTTGNETTSDLVVKANYVFMAAVVLMILPVIYASDSSSLGDLYYRFLAAAGIIDAVLTLVAVILNKIYLQKHPKIESALYATAPTVSGGQPAEGTQATQPKKHMNIFVILLIGYLIIQLVASLIFATIGKQATKNAKTTEINQPAITQTTPEPAPTYSAPVNAGYVYEKDFTYNTYNYSCTRTIPGTWVRLNTASNESSIEGTFRFKPAELSDLNTYCKIANY